MYPYFLFAAIHHLKSSSTFSVRPCGSVGRVTVDLFWRSWVRFPPRSKYFFFVSCGSLFPFTRANAQRVIHGFKQHFNLHFRVNSLFHSLCSQCYAAQHSWSERGSGWLMDKILKAFFNVAQNQPMSGGSFMVLPAKLKNKRAIINIQNRDNQCLRWAIRAVLCPAPRGRNPIRTSSYPTEDGLNFAGIDFPTPVSQIDRLERQNTNLAINVFGWENNRVIIHRISEKGGETPRINLMLIKQSENTHYSYVKRLKALLYDQNRRNESKHF